MKKLYVKNYEFAREGETPIPYNVRESMVDVLLNRTLKLRPVELLKRSKTAEKILSEKTDWVELEDAEYDALKAACEQIEGVGREDLELCRRILEPDAVFQGQ
jgi:hypothetical protein